MAGWIACYKIQTIHRWVMTVSSHHIRNSSFKTALTNHLCFYSKWTKGMCTGRHFYQKTRPWPAFGRQDLVGSSFEYSYTPAALGSVWNYDFGNGQNPFITWTFQRSDLPTFQPSDLPTFQPFPKVSWNRGNNKIHWKVIISRDFVISLFPDTFEYRKCLETGESTKFFEYFKGFCRFYCF